MPENGYVPLGARWELEEDDPIYIVGDDGKSREVRLPQQEEKQP